MTSVHMSFAAKTELPQVFILIIFIYFSFWKHPFLNLFIYLNYRKTRQIESFFGFSI